MASRARIAAAACLMASGLLVTGGSASLAFANPDDGGAAAGGGATSGNTEGSPAGQSPGPTKAEPTTTPGASAGGVTGSTGASGHPPKPRFTIGNGRTGEEVSTSPGGPTGSTGTGQPGKVSDDVSDNAEPTADVGSGKPEEGAPVDGEIIGDGSGEVIGDGSGEIIGDGTGEATGDGAGAAASNPIGDALRRAAESLNHPAPTAPQPVDPAALDPALLLGALSEQRVEAPSGEVAQVSGLPWSWWGWGSTPGSNGETPEYPAGPIPLLLQIPVQILYEINGIAQPLIEAAVTGLATAASHLPFPPASTLPLFVSPGPNAGVGMSAGGGSRGAGTAVPEGPRFTPPAVPPPVVAPDPPRHVTAPPPVKQQTSPPASPASNELLAAPTYRMGYVDYLRAAGMGEVAAVAVPGVTGILVLTSAGGLIGYRQARAGRAVRAGGPARFMG
ncbi:hypothetical protein [Mycolicibacterium sp. YH-1]|uniref:hypothetical protein n=1 Tax=Mycolicibacterium sp. YH-1 TaxID=2908837 RepID=UPI001F4C31B5|nr:hypothetical protein [Mycolicibacterium sp. YH-1]UNB53059.1 hypothetical protein L0M16_01365 [Mycolicibacterium sp. YH-1]